MSYSLVDKLYANKPYLETVDVLGRKVEFRVLSGQEEDEVLKASSANTYLELLQARRIPTLARAVKSIDGVEWKDFEEIKQRLRSNPELTLAQATEAELRQPVYAEDVVSSFYLAYTDFKFRYRETLDSLKKNSTQPNPVTVG